VRSMEAPVFDSAVATIEAILELKIRTRHDLGTRAYPVLRAYTNPKSARGER